MAEAAKPQTKRPRAGVRWGGRRQREGRRGD